MCQDVICFILYTCLGFYAILFVPTLYVRFVDRNNQDAINISIITMIATVLTLLLTYLIC